MALGQMSRSKTIDERLNELIPKLSDRRFAFKMADHQRQRLFCADMPVSGDSLVISLPVNVKLSANDLVSIYLRGGSAHSCTCTDILEYYTLLYDYVTLWAERSNAMPDEDMPPIEDFVNIDDYLASIHDEYFLQSVISAKPQKPATSSFRTRRFAAAMSSPAPVSPLDKPKRYESLISKFHDTVWRRHD